MGQQSITGAVTMKCLAVLALALATASAIHIPAKYAHYKPGYMRIPGWEKIASGERKLNQKAATMKFTPRDEIDTRATCGTPGPMALDDFEKIVGGVEATPHQFPWQVGLFFDGYFCGGSIISSKYILTLKYRGKTNRTLTYPCTSRWQTSPCLACPLEPRTSTSPWSRLDRHSKRRMASSKEARYRPSDPRWPSWPSPSWLPH